MEKENQKSIDEIKDKVQDLKDSKRSENTDSEEKDLSIEEKYKELEDKLTRSYAEIENQRRRYEKEIDDAFQYGGMALAKETLNIADNLERSKLSITNDQNLDLKSKDKIIEHIDIIYKDVVSIFSKNQIEEIKALDEKMDPNKHQAMMEVEDENKDPGTIVQEIQKGYMLKGRLLRPSLVGVSKKASKEEKNTEKTEKKEGN